MAAVVTSTLVDRPLFCDLLTHAPLNLERNVSLDAVRAYKIASIERVAVVSELLGDAVPGLGQAGGRKAVAAITAFAAAFWQVSHPPETLARFYDEAPEFGHSVLDFAGRLEDLTTAVLTGLVRGESPGA